MFFDLLFLIDFIYMFVKKKIRLIKKYKYMIFMIYKCLIKIIFFTFLYFINNIII